jgi:hypothetical protein
MIEVLHARLEDTECAVEVWIDGVEVKSGNIVVDVDPGRGYTREEWDERIRDARQADYSAGFAAALVAALEEFADSEHIR